MSDTLIVSGGGSIAIATDTLFAAVASIEALRGESLVVARALANVDGLVRDGGLRLVNAPVSAFDAEVDIETALRVVRDLDSRADATATAVRLVAGAYGLAESGLEAAGTALAARLGYAFGSILPLIAALATPAVLWGAASFFAASRFVPGGHERMAGMLGEAVLENNRVLNNPVTVALVGAFVTSADDVGAGLLRIPPPIAAALGDEGLGITGISTTAGLLLTGARFGIFAEGPVSATRVTTTQPSSTPHGLIERIDRIPSPVAAGDGAQIRIDTYSEPGRADRFEVFIAGTVDFSPVTGGEAFDLTSNIATMAELPPGSYRAVVEALEQAGVTRESEISLVGHSQGGLLAREIAASGDFTVVNVLTTGAPQGPGDIAPGVSVLELVHTDDIVPVLGGPRRDLHSLVVERQAFGGGAVPSHEALPSHARETYRETARLTEGSPDPRLARTVARFDAFSSGDVSVSSSTWVARRE